MNWDDPTERLRLIERVGVPEYNRQMAAHLDSLPIIHLVATRFGMLHAIRGTRFAFSTREEAEEYLNTKN